MHLIYVMNPVFTKATAVSMKYIYYTTVRIWVVDKADVEFPRMHQCFQSVYIL